VLSGETYGKEQRDSQRNNCRHSSYRRELGALYLVKGRVFHGRRKMRETLKQSPKVDRRDNK